MHSKDINSRSDYLPSRYLKLGTGHTPNVNDSEDNISSDITNFISDLETNIKNYNNISSELINLISSLKRTENDAQLSIITGTKVAEKCYRTMFNHLIYKTQFFGPKQFDYLVKNLPQLHSLKTLVLNGFNIDEKFERSSNYLPEKHPITNVSFVNCKISDQIRHKIINEFQASEVVNHLKINDKEIEKSALIAPELAPSGLKRTISSSHLINDLNIKPPKVAGKAMDFKSSQAIPPLQDMLGYPWLNPRVGNFESKTSITPKIVSKLTQPESMPIFADLIKQNESNSMGPNL